MPYKLGYFSTLVFRIKFTFPLQRQSWAHKRWGWLKCWQAEHQHSRGPEGFLVVGNQSAGALVCSSSPLPRWCLLDGQEDFWKESRVTSAGSVYLSAAAGAAVPNKPPEVRKLEGKLLCSIPAHIRAKASLKFPGSVMSSALLNVKRLARDPPYKR